MKSTLKYLSGQWKCKNEKLFKLLEPHKKPNDELLKALKEFRRRYYSNEPDEDNNFPWEKHKNSGGDLDTIKSLVTAEYELTWHWRLLLPHLRNFKHIVYNGQSLVLCVSQIRQWQLVSCFQMDWPDEADSHNIVAELRTRRKALLRPPVFGISHRIRHWEVYASFYEPGVLKQIQEAVDKAKSDRFRLAHVLGRYDAYIRIKNITIEGHGVYGAHIEQVVDVEPEQAPATLCDAHTDNVCRPYGLASVPQYPDGGKPGDINTTLCNPMELLFSSDSYCKAFEEISNVLNDANSRAVLVIAPPGSGKENLCTLFHSCRIHYGKLVRISLVGLDAQSAAFQLFHYEPDLDKLKLRFEEKNGELVPKDPLTDEFAMTAGAVFKALYGTLVIDELDKVSEDVRGMLLRFLESDEVTIPGTSVTVKIPERMRPLYVFAGSKPKNEFLELKPIDFWSRITHTIEMQHPLNGGEHADPKRAAEDRQHTAEDYIRLFWLQQVGYYFQKEQLLDKTKVHGKPVDPKDDLFEPMRTRFAAWWKFFVSREVGDFVAEELAKAYTGQGQHVPSVRTLRVATSSCFNTLFYALLYHRDDDSPLQIWEKEFCVGDKEPIRELMTLIGKFRRTDGNKHTLSPNELEAIVELQKLISANVTTRG